MSDDRPDDLDRRLVAIGDDLERAVEARLARRRVRRPRRRFAVAVVALFATLSTAAVATGVVRMPFVATTTEPAPRSVSGSGADGDALGVVCRPVQVSTGDGLRCSGRGIAPFDTRGLAPADLAAELSRARVRLAVVRWERICAPSACPGSGPLPERLADARGVLDVTRVTAVVRPDPARRTRGGGPASFSTSGEADYLLRVRDTGETVERTCPFAGDEAARCPSFANAVSASPGAAMVERVAYARCRLATGDCEWTASTSGRRAVDAPASSPVGSMVLRYEFAAPPPGSPRPR